MDDGEGDDSDEGEERAPRAGNGDEVDMDTDGQRAAGGEVVDEPGASQGDIEPPLPFMPEPPEPHPIPRPEQGG